MLLHVPRSFFPAFLSSLFLPSAILLAFLGEAGWPVSGLVLPAEDKRYLLSGPLSVDAGGSP